MNPTIKKVTDRIIERSKITRAAYLADCEENMRPGPRRKRLSEGNVAHASAACPVLEKTEIRREMGQYWHCNGL